MEQRWDRGVRSLTTGPRPDAPVLAFLPGLGALGYVADAVAGCGSWAEAYLLDLPGFGHPLPCAPEVPALAAAVVSWLDAIAPGRDVVLAGHSTGAQVALRAAAARPVRSLALLGPTFPPSQRTLRGLVGPVLRTVPRERPGLVGATVPYYARGPAPSSASSAPPCTTPPNRSSPTSTPPSSWPAANTTASPRGNGSTTWSPAPATPTW
ncbi:alpha/beta fold hydrolase [Actinokineospora soli]|uniref:Alpha/beta fold hydrolase n=1 Tax=Actinokineospora soli TaxID=1048753 RepID=A0ABW2TRP0_9PSEU